MLVLACVPTIDYIQGNKLLNKAEQNSSVLIPISIQG